MKEVRVPEKDCNGFAKGEPMVCKTTGILWSIVLLSFLSVTSCAVVHRLEVRPLDTTSAEPITVASPVKAHLTDGSTVVFDHGVTVADGKVMGEGRKYDIGLETGVRVSSIPLDDVAAMESYRTPVKAGETAGANVVAAPFVLVGIALLLIAFGG